MLDYPVYAPGNPIIAMEHEFWHERWMTKQLGFHLDRVNPWLVRFFPRLDIAPGEPVFVPLCGKSLDLRWLASEGHPVIGVELSPIAVRDFFMEQGLEPESRARGRFSVWRHGGITLYCGDFFDLRAEDLPQCAALYDRAALIALPPEMRAGYVAHLASLLPGGARGLLITLEYPQAEMDGPPFSVGTPEVSALFGATFAVEHLEEHDVLEHHPRFRERGLTRLVERAYLLTRR